MLERGRRFREVAGRSKDLCFDLTKMSLEEYRKSLGGYISEIFLSQ